MNRLIKLSLIADLLQIEIDSSTRNYYNYSDNEKLKMKYNRMKNGFEDTEP